VIRLGLGGVGVDDFPARFVLFDRALGAQLPESAKEVVQDVVGKGLGEGGL
jgi:hypothetical protein